MKQLWNHLWLRTLAVLLLVAALLAPVLLPALHLHRQAPENPIQEENILPVEPLSFGDGLGGSRPSAADPAASDGSGAQGETPDAAQDAQEEPEEQPQDDRAETPAPAAQDPLDHAAAPSDERSGEDSDEPSGDGTGASTAPDLALVLNWQRYGSESYRSLCPAGDTVRQDIRAAQLPDGQLRYELELRGLDAASTEITAVYLSENSAAPSVADVHGAIRMQTGPDGADGRYQLTVEAVCTRVQQDGTQLQEPVSFSFVLVYSDALDIEAELRWLRADGETSRLLCQPDRQSAASLTGDALPEGLLQYTLRLDGSDAADARILSASYAAQTGETGSLEPSGGTLTLQGGETGENLYTLTLLAEVTRGGRTRQLTFAFRLSFRAAQSVALELTWLKNTTQSQTLSCEPGKQVSAELRRTELRQGLLEYRLALTGEQAAQATLLSASLQPEGGAAQTLAIPDGSATLTLPEGASSLRYLLTVQARLQRADGSLRTLTFTYALRYSGGVALDMQYTLLDGSAKNVRCADGQRKTAETVYSDELTDGVLPFTLTLTGDDSTDRAQITALTCFQSGSGKQTALPAQRSGSIPLLVNEDGTTGENQFRITAGTASGETYSFTINIPYKLRGDGIVKIETNLDDEPKVMNGTKITLNVTAWSERKDDGSLIARMTASDTVVTLDGETLRCDGASGGRLQYTMIPQNPEVGDENEHILKIVCEDAYGNRGEKTLTLPGERSRKGEPIGWANIYIDMTVLGLGVTQARRYEVLSGEAASYSVAKAVWGYDAGDPFGAAVESFGWPASESGYDNSFDVGFYLTKLGDGTYMASRTNALRSSWSDYQIGPGNSQEENLARIDALFGENSPYAALWRSIYLAGIEINPCHDYSVGQFDYTRSSGWMYSIGGGTNYPIKGLSEYELRDGDVLVLRYTLAVGRDIGDAGQGSSFCVSALNGDLSVSHQWHTVTGEDGSEQTVCASCGKLRACEHPEDELEYCESEDGTQCYQFCRKCQKPVTEPEAHSWEISPIEGNETQHKKTCSRCKKEQLEDHRFEFLENTATCEQAGQTVRQCVHCHYETRTPTEATGHQPQQHANAAEHWQECAVCGQELEGTRAAHTYQWDPLWNDWTCSGCGFTHSQTTCPGTPEAVSDRCTCSHEELRCAACGLTFTRDEPGAFADRYPHSFAAVAEGSNCSREVRVCTACGAQEVVEQTGAFADRYPHQYDELTGECIYCHTKSPGGPTEPPTGPDSGPKPEPDPEPEHTEE